MGKKQPNEKSQEHSNSGKESQKASDTDKMAATAGPFLQSLTAAPQDFLQPSLPLHTDALAYLKNTLDPVALDVSAVQQQRLLDARRKRKRGEVAEEDEVLRLKKVNLRGFEAEQVWQQVRMVLEATRKEAEIGLAEAEAREAEESGSESGGEEGESELGEEGVDWTYDGEDVSGEEEGSDGEEDSEMVDGEDAHDDYEDDEDVEMGSDLDGEDDVRPEEPVEDFVEDKFGLNDGFFSIDNFNKQSEFMEQQGDEDAGSDDEDIDWDADPATMAAGAAGADGGAEDESDDEEDGPTFGDPDAPSEDEDEDLEGGDMDIGGMGNTNNVMYADFFAPPAQKARKNKKGRPNPHNFPAKGPATENDENEGQDEDMTRTMEAVHRDLFEDESEGEDEEDQEALDPADPKSRRSAHERRKLALQEEIRKLEAANVAKREWTLSGEARAADRPMNSLLEEDLDFERAGKPVPVITAEVSEGLEELIKRRILAHDFQDIIRRRPDDLATGNGRRGQLDFELDNNKSKKGLAEEYEEEHLRNTDPNYVDEKDEKTAKEEKEIEALWREVSANLDSLSSWHFKPKRPEAQLDIRVDAPTITMEDARPNAGGEVAGASQLAPQEIYKAGDGAKGNGAEVVGKSGLPAGREELTREEKTRRRRRDKERARKAGTNEPTKVESKGKKDKKDMLSDLKKGGVKVIGSKGEMKDVEGNKVKTGDVGSQGASRYKL
jgi:U3 small nucleolar RNA-associated protein MPP10